MILNAIAGACFFLTAIIGKNIFFIPVGCCFVLLGIINFKNNKSK